MTTTGIEEDKMGEICTAYDENDKIRYSFSRTEGKGTHSDLDVDGRIIWRLIMRNLYMGWIHLP